MRIRELVHTSIFTFLLALTVHAQCPDDLLKISASNANGFQNDVICVDFSVENFINVQTLQFTINFDPTVLQPQCPPTQINLLGLAPVNFNCGETDQGHIKILWLDPNSGQACGETLNDGEVIFTLCFDLIGDPGKEAPVYVSNSQLEVEYSMIPDCNDLETFVNCDQIEIDTASVIIDCGSLSVFARNCDSAPGMNTGSLTFYACGGNAPYSYDINNGQLIGTNIQQRFEVNYNDLEAGTYDIAITDASGNKVNTTIVISSNDPLTLDRGILDVLAPNCFNSRTSGKILNAYDAIAGGVPPYRGTWENFNFFTASSDKNKNSRTGLRNGTYYLTITDNNNCQIEEEILVFVDTLKASAELISNASCEGGTDGVVRISATGGTPYNGIDYSFNGNVPLPSFTDTQVPGGWFYFRASDAASPTCSSDLDSIFVGTDAVFTANLEVEDISCAGADDGSILASVTGGNNNFRWTLINENGDPPASARQNMTTYESFELTEGFWFFTAEDRLNECQFMDTFLIGEPPLMVTTMDSINPTCLGNDGEIVLTAEGGTITSGYTFSWVDGATDSLRTGLTGGNYQVTVSDDNGCSDEYDIQLTADGQIIVDAQVTKEIACNGFADGEVAVTVDSPGEFAYRWFQGSDTLGTNTTLGNLSAGSYIIQVIDTILGCNSFDTVELVDPLALGIEVNYTLPSCPFPEFTNGSIGVGPLSGSGPFSYLWDDGSTGSVRAAITAGEYAVTVSDDNACTLDTILILENPDKIQVMVSDIDGVTCNGTNTGSATAVASGGTVNNNRYNFFWSSGPIDTDFDVGVSMASGLPAGTQYVIVADAVCPSDTLFFEVPDIEPVQLDSALTIINTPSCYEDCDGSATAVAIGGNTTSYNYQWILDNSTSSTISGLCAGTYYVEIIDANNCMATDSIIVSEPDSLSVIVNSATTIDPNCFNTGNAQIGVVSSGGTPDYGYQWSGNVSTEEIGDSLRDGTYVITVTDANGCTDVTSYILVSPEPITAFIPEPNRPQCFGEQSCITVDSAQGGSGVGYTFTVNRGIRLGLDECQEVFAGPYTVTVFDSEGCSEEYQVEVVQPEPIIVTLGDDMNVSLGEESPPINAEISAVYDITSIVWNPIDSLECLTADCQVISVTPYASALYTVTVVDENGCVGTDDILISVSKRRNVFAANIFSPNQDGFNDYFQLVTGTGVRKVNEFVVFDRWGNTVWKKSDFTPDPSGKDGWDGSINGTQAAPGVYGYVAKISFIDDEEIVFKGSITLIR